MPRLPTDLAVGDFIPKGADGHSLEPIASSAITTVPAPTSIYASTKLMQEYLLRQGLTQSGVETSIERLPKRCFPLKPGRRRIASFMQTSLDAQMVLRQRQRRRILQMTDNAYDQRFGKSVVHKQQDKIEKFILNLDKDKYSTILML